MIDEQQDQLQQVEEILAEAYRLQDAGLYPESIGPVNSARDLLHAMNPPAPPRVDARSLRLLANAGCRSGKQEDLAVCEKQIEQALSLVPRTHENDDDRELLGQLWHTRAAIHWHYRNPTAYRNAIAAYDTAIDLRQQLDLTRPEFRNDLARSWTNRGLALLAEPRRVCRRL
jgi:hypothetical protein